jgi:hypothetical protein
MSYVCINYEFIGEDDKDWPDDVITCESSSIALVPRVGETVRLWSQRFKNGNYQEDKHVCERQHIRSAEGVVVSIEHDIEERGGNSRDWERVHYVTIVLKRTRKAPPHRRK